MQKIMNRLMNTVKNNYLNKVQCLFVLLMLMSGHQIYAQAIQYTTTANGLEKFKTTKLMPTGISNTENNTATIQM